MAIEVLNTNTHYEAFLHHVGEGGFRGNYYHTIGTPSIAEVSGLQLSEVEIETLAWAHLSEQASVVVRHGENLLAQPNWGEEKNAPYHVPDYPNETLYGQRLLHKETYLVTDRSGTDLEFTALSDIIETQTLTPYAKRWLGILATSRTHFSFESYIDMTL